MQTTIIYMFTSEFAMSAVALWSSSVHFPSSVDLRNVLPSLMSVVMWCIRESAVMQ